MPVSILLALKLVNPLPLPVNTPVLAVILAAVMFPLTPNPVSVPTLVTLGCAAVVSVPATVVNTPAAAPILPTLALPVTLSVPRVPTVVKLDVTIPEASVVPVKLAAFAVIAVFDAAVN